MRELHRVAAFDAGFFRVEQVSLAGRSSPVTLLRMPDWVMTVAVDARAAFVLVRQHRFGIAGETVEPAGGLVDPGEAPEACAARELAEETGYTATTLVPLLPLWTTPGFTDEKIHLFAATGLRKGEHRREADEFLEVHELRWSAVGRMIEGGEIRDAKTLAALFLARFRFLGDQPTGGSSRRSRR